MSRLVDILSEVETRISLKKALGDYSIGTTFTVERSWFPVERLETLSSEHPTGKVYIIGMGGDDSPLASRSGAALTELPVQVGYQRQVDPQDTATINTLVEFMEQLQDTLRLNVNLRGYNWVRNETLKDPNGTPFAFMGLRDAAVFEAYFTAFFIYPLDD